MFEETAGVQTLAEPFLFGGVAALEVVDQAAKLDNGAFEGGEPAREFLVPDKLLFAERAQVEGDQREGHADEGSQNGEKRSHGIPDGCGHGDGPTQ
jgi:hypothetical protein